MKDRAPIRAVLLYASCLPMLAGGVLATEELAKSEDAVCTECHVKPGFKRLTDRGKFFEATRSLDGYAEIEASFGQCTFCHRRKAGSKKLTKVGRGFAEVLAGMEGVADWVRDRHPGWLEPAAADADVEVTVEPGGEPRPETDGRPPLPFH